MTKTVYILGVNHEAINVAILLASLKMSVVVVGSAEALAQTLHHYQFDHQMGVLWQLYQSEQKIHLLTDKWLFLADEVLTQAHTFWLFVDELGADFCAQFAQHCHSPHSQILLSGTDTVGAIQALAERFKSPWVFYLPFIFMKDGANFNTLFSPDLVLIGEKSADSHLQSDILAFFIAYSNQHHIGDIKTVEFARSAIMVMLATRLSLMNELARLADSENINIKHVQTMMAKDKRVGGAYLSAGWGFGGKSLPSELQLLTDKFAQNRVSTSLLDAVSSINEDQKELIFRKFWRYFGGFIENKRVVIWGAAYRCGTGRTMGSAIHPLLRLLWSYQIGTVVYGHHTQLELQELYGQNPLLQLSDEPYGSLTQADALFIINWSPVLRPDIGRLNQIRVPIFDAKNILSDDDVAAYQGAYFGIGRQKP